MKKRNILTTIALLITLLVHAQSSNEASVLLNKTYNLFEASKGIKLNFRAATLDTNGSEQMAMDGTAFIKGNKFRLETDQLDIWFDGATQWVLMKEVDEVNISTPTGEELTAVSPLALLGIYRNGYTLSAPVAKTVKGKKLQMVKMVPANHTGDYTEVEAYINPNNHTLAQAVLTLRNGTKQLVEISNYNANHNFADTEFRFNKALHPKVEIVDLR